jgi:hypothetical protein
LTTYATLNQVKDELVMSYSNTNYDAELNNLLSLVDAEINTILQKYTSHPVQSEIATQFSYLEARMCAIHFRMKRATPPEQNQLQAVLKNNQALLQGIIESNFKRSFFAEGSRSEEDNAGAVPWRWQKGDY